MTEQPPKPQSSNTVDSPRDERFIDFVESGEPVDRKAANCNVLLREGTPDNIELLSLISGMIDTALAQFKLSDLPGEMGIAIDDVLNHPDSIGNHTRSLNDALLNAQPIIDNTSEITALNTRVNELQANIDNLNPDIHVASGTVTDRAMRGQKQYNLLDVYDAVILGYVTLAECVKYSNQQMNQVFSLQEIDTFDCVGLLRDGTVYPNGAV